VVIAMVFFILSPSGGGGGGSVVSQDLSNSPMLITNTLNIARFIFFS
jgi:hypothetical protein